MNVLGILRSPEERNDSASPDFLNLVFKHEQYLKRAVPSILNTLIIEQGHDIAQEKISTVPAAEEPQSILNKDYLKRQLGDRVIDEAAHQAWRDASNEAELNRVARREADSKMEILNEFSSENPTA